MVTDIKVLKIHFSLMKYVILYQIINNSWFAKQISVTDVYMEASDPKLVNPVLWIIGVNSLRLGGLHILS